MKRSEEKCPKCGEEFKRKEFYHSADHEGIISRIVHSEKTVETPFGSNKVAEDTCFLTVEEAKEIFDIVHVEGNHYKLED